jgi:hypothetical protein
VRTLAHAIAVGEHDIRLAEIITAATGRSLVEARHRADRAAEYYSLAGSTADADLGTSPPPSSLDLRAAHQQLRALGLEHISRADPGQAARQPLMVVARDALAFLRNRADYST